MVIENDNIYLQKERSSQYRAHYEGWLFKNLYCVQLQWIFCSNSADIRDPWTWINNACKLEKSMKNGKKEARIIGTVE